MTVAVRHLMTDCEERQNMLGATLLPERCGPRLNRAVHEFPPAQSCYRPDAIRFEAGKVTHVETETPRAWQYKDLPESVPVR